MEKRCRRCKKILTPENTYPCLYNKILVCKECISQRQSELNKIRLKNNKNYRKKRNEYSRNYRARHKKYFRNKVKQYQRDFIVHINGHPTRVEKKAPRPQDNRCQVCSNLPKKLLYHHPTDERPDIGIWVCSQCHIVAETVDAIKGKKKSITAQKTNKYEIWLIAQQIP